MSTLTLTDEEKFVLRAALIFYSRHTVRDAETRGLLAVVEKIRMRLNEPEEADR